MSRSGRGGDGGPYRMKPSSNRSASAARRGAKGSRKSRKANGCPKKSGAVPAATISGAGSASAGANPAASHSRARSSVRASRCAAPASAASSGGAATIAVGPPTGCPRKPPGGRAGDRGRARGGIRGTRREDEGVGPRLVRQAGEIKPLEHPVDPTGADHLGVQAGARPADEVRRSGDRGRRPCRAPWRARRSANGRVQARPPRPASRRAPTRSATPRRQVGRSTGRAKAKRADGAADHVSSGQAIAAFLHGRADHRPRLRGPGRDRSAPVRASRRSGLPAPRFPGLASLSGEGRTVEVRRSRIGAMAVMGARPRGHRLGARPARDRRQRRPRSHAARGRTPLRSARRAGTGGVVDRQR